jgi:hypothetical protein
MCQFCLLSGKISASQRVGAELGQLFPRDV